MSSKKPAPKPAAKADPKIATDALWKVARKLDDLEDEMRKAEGKVVDAQLAVKEAESERDYVAAKMLRVTKLVGDQVQAVASEKPTDAGLLTLLKSCKQAPWVKLQRAGASDEQILTILKTGWPDYRNSSRPNSCEGGYNPPRAWIARSGYGQKPTFEGKALAVEARRLLKIPPAKALPAPAKPATAKASPAKSSPGGSGGGGQAKPAAAAKKPATKATPAKPAAAKEELATGVEKVNIDTMPIGLGVGWLLVQKTPDLESESRENWQAGYQLDVGRLGRLHLQPMLGLPQDTRAEALENAICDLIEQTERSIKAKKLKGNDADDATALLKAFREFQDKVTAEANKAVAGKHAEAAPGTVPWAIGLGFDSVNQARAKTIAALPESLRHLMRDTRVGDNGDYTGYQPRLLACPAGVGEAHAFTVEDGDGQIHAGWSVYFTIPRLGNPRCLPTVSSRHINTEEALRWALAQMIDAAEKAMPPHAVTPKEWTAIADMKKSLVEAEGAIGKEAARGVGVQPARPSLAAAVAKGKGKRNGKHGTGPQQAGFMPVGAGAAAAALPS